MDFIVSRSQDPGWVGQVIGWLLDPPPWSLLPLIASGLLLIWWDVRQKGRGQVRKHVRRDMTHHRPTRFFKVVVCFERRPDGGLRAYSDAVPGLVLSHRDVDKLLADIKPALETILSAHLGCDIVADELADIRRILESNGVVDPPSNTLTYREYVAQFIKRDSA